MCFHTTVILLTSTWVYRCCNYKIKTYSRWSKWWAPSGQKADHWCTTDFTLLTCQLHSTAVFVHSHEPLKRTVRWTQPFWNISINTITALWDWDSRSFWLTFETWPARISTGLPIIPIEVVKVSLTIQRPLPSTYLPIHCSLIIISFDTV
jgi:hypothetical protein